MPPQAAVAGPASLFDDDSALAATLGSVARLMAAASYPWWIIGSAAVALHIGRDVGVRDVDVVLDEGDAASIRHELQISPVPSAPHPLFRSQEYFRWDGNALPVEFMAGFALRVDGKWHAIELSTRRPFRVGAATVYAPEAGELAALLRRFGRPKDRARLALLQAGGFSV